MCVISVPACSGRGNVHEVAQQAAPGSRVVYADVNPVAIAHSKALLDGNPDADIIDADLREPEKILAHPTTRQLIDFSQPTGLLLGMVLHFIADAEDPWAVVATLRDALAPGSYLVLSHVNSRTSRPDKARATETVYNRSVATQRANPSSRGPTSCVSSTDSSYWIRAWSTSRSGGPTRRPMRPRDPSKFWGPGRRGPKTLTRGPRKSPRFVQRQRSVDQRARIHGYRSPRYVAGLVGKQPQHCLGNVLRLDQIGVQNIRHPARRGPVAHRRSKVGIDEHRSTDTLRGDQIDPHVELSEPLRNYA